MLKEFLQDFREEAIAFYYALVWAEIHSTPRQRIEHAARLAYDNYLLDSCGREHVTEKQFIRKYKELIQAGHDPKEMKISQFAPKGSENSGDNRKIGHTLEAALGVLLSPNTAASNVAVSDNNPDPEINDPRILSGSKELERMVGFGPSRPTEQSSDDDWHRRRHHKYIYD